MSYWNHRIIKRIVDGDEMYGIHEVFYDQDGNITATTEIPIEIEAASIEELKQTVQWINDCFNKPILIESEIDYKPFEEEEDADE